jgi:flagellar hook-associated protein 3 FlgL
MEAQVQSILQQVTSEANAQFGGAYLFSGSQTNTPPYDAIGNYAGDASNNFATFSDGTTTQTTSDGKAIFGDVNSGLIGTLTSLQTALLAGNKVATAATLSQLQASVQNLGAARGRIGVNENSLQTFLSNAGTEGVTLQTSISNLTDVDVAKAALDQQQALLQEQALVSMASGLGKIPLVNILA